jgi:hypothetical protein
MTWTSDEQRLVMEIHSGVSSMRAEIKSLSKRQDTLEEDHKKLVDKVDKPPRWMTITVGIFVGMVGLLGTLLGIILGIKALMP